MSDIPIFVISSKYDIVSEVVDHIWHSRMKTEVSETIGFVDRDIKQLAKSIRFGLPSLVQAQAIVVRALV